MSNKQQTYGIIIDTLLSVSIAAVLYTVVSTSRDLANGIVSSKYFWFYASMALSVLAIPAAIIKRRERISFKLPDLLLLLFCASAVLITLNHTGRLTNKCLCSVSFFNHKVLRSKFIMKQLIIILSIIALFSCSNNNKKQKLSAIGSHVSQTVSNSGLMQQVPFKLIEIDTENSIEITRAELDGCVTELKYIYLKTEEPVGYISKIVIHKDKIFVIDYHSTNKIFIFDMEGNLINIIADKGGGPQEYLQLGYADISTDEIIIADGQSMKRLYYTLEGKFIRQERCLPCLQFAVLENKFILHTGYGQTFNDEIAPHLIVSIKDSAIRRALPYSNIQKKTTSGALTYNYEGDLLFSPVLSDTVYQILTEFTYSAKYFIKHKKSIWQKHNANLDYYGILNLTKDEGYTTLETQFHETEKYVHFVIGFVEAGKILGDSYWYDKENKQTYCFKGDANENWVSRFIPYIEGIWGNYYLAYMWPDQIVEIREHQEKTKGTKDTFNIKNTELRKIIETADEDPNQVIVLYKYDFGKLKK